MRKLARPHFVRAALVLVLAVAGLVVASAGQIRRFRGPPIDPVTSSELLLAIAGSCLWLVFGVIALRMFVRGVRAATGGHLGDSRAKPLGTVLSAVGYVIILLALLQVLDVKITGLLLGGALTGVIVGIAAQQTLGNFFAGIVLLLNRPFSQGELIVLRSGPLGGEYEGIVTEMGLFYVRLQTEYGPVQLPNAGVLASAIGPGARSPKEEPQEQPETAGTSEGGPA